MELHRTATSTHTTVPESLVEAIATLVWVRLSPHIKLGIEGIGAGWLCSYEQLPPQSKAPLRQLAHDIIACCDIDHSVQIAAREAVEIWKRMPDETSMHPFMDDLRRALGIDWRMDQ